MKCNTFQRVKKLIRPSEDWGPALEHHRVLYLASLGHNTVEANLEMVSSIQPSLPREQPQQDQDKQTQEEQQAILETRPSGPDVCIA